MKTFIKKGLFYLLALSLSCSQHDSIIQILGSYKVYQLQVFSEKINTSKDFVGMITLTKTDGSHVMLGIDIRYKTDEPTPVETLCTLLPTSNNIQLIEHKTNEVLGYLENGEIHLISSDLKGAKTEIIGKKL